MVYDPVHSFPMPCIPTIIGHEREREQLTYDITSDNVAHTYLFVGPAHLGKMTIAQWFSHELLTVGVDAAQRASIEHHIERRTHPDLLTLDQLWIEEECEDWSVIAKTSNVPQAHRAKAGAKTDTISIDDIRELHDRLIGTPLSRYRCCIIRSAHRMQENASNIFLKILEEPPAGLVFILTAPSTSMLLPTIVSRSRVVAFRRVAESHLRQMLLGISEDDAQFILSISQGAPGMVRRLRDDPDALRIHRLHQNAAAAFWQTSSLAERLSYLQPLLKRGKESDQFLLHLSLALRLRPQRSMGISRALLSLLHGLKTNAHRELIAQRFALATLAEAPSLARST